MSPLPHIPRNLSQADDFLPGDVGVVPDEAFQSLPGEVTGADVFFHAPALHHVLDLVGNASHGFLVALAVFHEWADNVRRIIGLMDPFADHGVIDPFSGSNGRECEDDEGGEDDKVFHLEPPFLGIRGGVSGHIYKKDVIETGDVKSWFRPRGF